MRTIIFLNGQYGQPSLYKNIINKNDKIICADGGYNFYKKLNCKEPDIIIGDMDSINSVPENAEIYPREKDQTDGELAFQQAVDAKEVLIFGAFGARKDQEIANLAMAEQILNVENSVTYIDEYTKLIMVKGKKTITFQVENYDLVSLIPWSERVEKITTDGLKYKLSQETLYKSRTRGVSNVPEREEVNVSFGKGTLMIILQKLLK